MVHNPAQYYHPINEDIGKAILKKDQMIKQVPKLLQPITIKSITLANRIGVSPMCMYSSEDGYLTDFHLAHYGQFVINGAGLIIVEATAVEPNGRTSPYCAGIYHDEHVKNHKRIVDLVHNLGGKIGIQIAHAGRKASTAPPYFPNPKSNVEVKEGGWTNVVGPSDEVWDTEGYVKPHSLTKEEIKKLIKSYKIATRRVIDAGYDILEIHGAHGYLVHSFLSPVSNHRTDEYGGSFENRTRFLLELVDGITQVWPKEKPLFIRLSSTDWVDQEDTWDIDQTVKLAQLLKAKGVDLVDASSGGNSPLQKIQVGPRYQVPFSHRIRKEAEVLTGAVGLIISPIDANSILEEEKADLIFIGREFLKDPSFVKRAGVELNQGVQWLKQYHYTQPLHRKTNNANKI
jgi:2,4-dienoyl-CoA reductase-like NADH-dependent reductase (Old Yellow Enzyme family)